MDLISLGCPILRWTPVERLMEAFAYLGYGVLDGAIAAAILAYGAATRNRRLRQAGWAALVAVLAAGALANLGKLLFEMPRPTPSDSFGFPSGHTTTAFAVAGALGQAFPAAAPFFYLLAVLAGVGRLFDRSHFVTDVIGGGLLGSVTGLLSARILLGRQEEPQKPRPRTRWAWLLPVAVGLPALLFFAAYERGIAAHRVVAAPSGTASFRIAFGTPEARSLLLDGWSEDGVWGTIPMVRAEGLHSTLRLPALPPGDLRLRVKVRPFVHRPGRPPCQIVEVTLNGAPVGRLLLEKGWNDYELRVPKNLRSGGESALGFRFAYAEPDGGRLFSAAFASFEAFVEGARGR